MFIFWCDLNKMMVRIGKRKIDVELFAFHMNETIMSDEWHEAKTHTTLPFNQLDILLNMNSRSFKIYITNYTTNNIKQLLTNYFIF